jgi:hypothetical protein
VHARPKPERKHSAGRRVNGGPRSAPSGALRARARRCAIPLREPPERVESGAHAKKIASARTRRRECSARRNARVRRACGRVRCAAAHRPKALVVATFPGDAPTRAQNPRAVELTRFPQCARMSRSGVRGACGRAPCPFSLHSARNAPILLKTGALNALVIKSRSPQSWPRRRRAARRPPRRRPRRLAARSSPLLRTFGL